jgi:hypothetical protein
MCAIERAEVSYTTGNDPMALVTSHHRARLVVPFAVGSVDSHRKVKFTRERVSVDVATVANVSIASDTPKVGGGIGSDGEFVALLGPSGRLVQPFHGNLFLLVN